MARPPRFWGEDPDHPAVRERADGIHQGVHQVTVVLAPPQQDYVHDLVGVLVEEVTADFLLDRGTHVIIDVLVPADLLDHHVRFDTEPFGDADPSSVFRGDHGLLLHLRIGGHLRVP
jgi:hypothetical protein